jgi:hypothetical protein
MTRCGVARARVTTALPFGFDSTALPLGFDSTALPLGFDSPQEQKCGRMRKEANGLPGRRRGKQNRPTMTVTGLGAGIKGVTWATPGRVLVPSSDSPARPNCFNERGRAPMQGKIRPDVTKAYALPVQVTLPIDTMALSRRHTFQTPVSWLSADIFIQPHAWTCCIFITKPLTLILGSCLD